MNIYRVIGDSSHLISILLFYVIARCRGNAAGISMRAHELFLLVFVMRYADLLTSFFSLYNTIMKILYIGGTGLIVYTLKYVEPAKSTYSPAQDSFKHWYIVIFTGIFSLVIHVIGSGVVDIRGGSGEEFEVHFENYEWFSFVWTFSMCLEPFAMLPQLYIFRKNRLIKKEIRFAMFFKGIYRLFYIFNWLHRSQNQMGYEHHTLVYIAGVLQVLMYIDFFFYHVSVCLLWSIRTCAGLTGDTSAMVADSGIERMSLVRDAEYSVSMGDDELEEEWSPDDAPTPNTIEMNELAGLKTY